MYIQTLERAEIEKSYTRFMSAQVDVRRTDDGIEVWGKGECFLKYIEAEPKPRYEQINIWEV